ncbi:MAG: peptidoglycan DD-metalloendopeptidase family protein [Candidatus Kerfeldbacteria bacterium]|nr:peptidoglycan DD-metalloendopeptidase family protein [Candidatus Kerfeldbacteria bacterium]
MRRIALVFALSLACSTAHASSMMPFMAGETWNCSQGNNAPYDPNYPDKYDHYASKGMAWAWDFNMPGTDSDVGEPVLAPEDGTVDEVVYECGDCATGWGRYVVIHQTDGRYVRLAHFMEVFVRLHERVYRGQVVGRLGNSGYSSGYHTHLQWQSSIHGSSIQASFADVGVPVEDGNYTSQNAGIFDLEYNSMGKDATYGSVLIGIGWVTPYDYTNPYYADGRARTCFWQRYQNNSGGWYRSGIVYDALGGARKAYTVRTGFWEETVDVPGTGDGWSENGGPQYWLGSPITNEYTWNGIARQDFQRGYLKYENGDVTAHYLASTPGWVGPGGYWDNTFSYLFALAYERNGGANTVGSPKTDDGHSGMVHQYGPYWRQDFSGGSFGNCCIMYDPNNSTGNSMATNEAYLLRTGFYEYYFAHGGYEAFGCPSRDEYNTSGTDAIQFFVRRVWDSEKQHYETQQHYMYYDETPPPPCGVVCWHSTYTTEYVSQTPSGQYDMLPCTRTSFTVRFKNTGQFTWRNDPNAYPYDYVELKSCQDGGVVVPSFLNTPTVASLNWINETTPVRMVESSVAPGQTATFTFNGQVALGTTPGVRNVYFRVYHPVGGLMTDWGQMNFPINVLDPNRYQAFTGKFNTDTKWDVGVWDKVNGDWSIALRDASVNRFNPAGYWLMDWAAGMGQYQMLTGDFSGDGYTDICAYHKDTGRWWVAYNQGTSFVQQNGPGPNGCWIDNWATGNGWVPLVGDFSGDGAADIAVYYPSLGRWFVAYNQGSRFEASNGPNANGSWLDAWAQETGEQWKVFAADVSGDHVADVLAYSPLYGRWFVAYNQGGRFQNASGPATNGSWITGWATEDGSQWRCFVTDLSGDGYADLLAYTPIYGRWFVAYNQGGYFNGASGPATNGSWLDNWALEQNGALWQVMTGNVSGDNVDDLVVFTPQTGRWFVAYNQGGQFIGESGLATAGSWLDNWGKLGQGVPPTRARPVPKEVPTTFSLNIAPNPMKSGTTVTFALPQSDHVRFTIYDVNGREVAKMPEQAFGPGQHSFVWSRTGLNGQHVQNGIYFVRLTSHFHAATAKVAVIN